MNISNKWIDYECLKTGNGEKLERWGNIILNRPDPQIIWEKKDVWNNYDGYYHRSNEGGGYWEYKKKLPEYWTVKYNNLTFKVSPTNFKHTGIFPEQAANWDYIDFKVKEYLKDHEEMHILNLFAYTGCATMAAANAGATEVVHVDASKSINEWAKENMKLCHLEDKTIRFIADDAIKFLEREKRRGHTYQGIIMDPPSYGRGPNKEVWKFENDFTKLLDKVKDVLDKDYSFLLISSYTTGISHISLENILKLKFPNQKIETGENCLPITENNLILPCGIYGKITKN
ncbi:MAG: class I SAM-dependent methyltransferase [Bacilli bacterium]|jgi:23S rRNA (cytosine1962-C5)-methyltransferase|nr:class I SAM-dependent methyltransferase [Bacilli bacterium]